MRAKIFLAFGFLAAVAALPTTLRADNCTGGGNLVQNCSFSSYSYGPAPNYYLTAPDWNITYALSGSLIWVDTTGSGYNGDNAAVFGASDYEYDTIAQTLTTTPSQTYTLAFWLINANSAGYGSDFQALWNGTQFLDQTTYTNGIVEFTFTVTGTGSDTLTFEGYNTADSYYLSDISVTANESPNPIPEPSSLWLLGSGLAGLAGMLRRRFV